VLAVGAGLLAAFALVGFAFGFAIASSAGASGPSAESPAQTVDPPPPPTEPPPPPTEPVEPPPAPIPPSKRLIEPGVTVGEVEVGWMTPRSATKLVQEAFARPFVLIASESERLRARPAELGARAKIEKAIRRARSARAGVTIPLDVEVSRTALRGYVARVAKRYDREAVDAAVVLRGVRPRKIEAQEGRQLKALRTGMTLRIALATHARDPIELEFARQKPKVTSVVFGSSVVILRDSKRLLLYSKDKLVRRFGIATGQASYPTPTGDYEITNMQRNPWWYPPPSDWAAESDPVPPGPGNPLGTRWMGISAPYVGIHGTPDAASIGYSASHGCVRMRIADAEWLFKRVKVGTPVFILPR
jgi:lipoprotein-anchoring transpeptidase ErfK/SrfK